MPSHQQGLHLSSCNVVNKAPMSPTESDSMRLITLRLQLNPNASQGEFDSYVLSFCWTHSLPMSRFKTNLVCDVFFSLSCVRHATCDAPASHLCFKPGLCLRLSFFSDWRFLCHDVPSFMDQSDQMFEFLGAPCKLAKTILWMSRCCRSSFFSFRFCNPFLFPSPLCLYVTQNSKCFHHCLLSLNILMKQMLQVTCHQFIKQVNFDPAFSLQIYFSVQPIAHLWAVYMGVLISFLQQLCQIPGQKDLCCDERKISHLRKNEPSWSGDVLYVQKRCRKRPSTWGVWSCWSSTSRNTRQTRTCVRWRSCALAALPILVWTRNLFPDHSMPDRFLLWSVQDVDFQT